MLVSHPRILQSTLNELTKLGWGEVAFSEPDGKGHQWVYRNPKGSCYFGVHFGKVEKIIKIDLLRPIERPDGPNKELRRYFETLRFEVEDNTDVLNQALVQLAKEKFSKFEEKKDS